MPGERVGVELDRGTAKEEIMTVHYLDHDDTFISAYTCQNIPIIHFEYEPFIEYQFCISKAFKRSFVVSLLINPSHRRQSLATEM